MTNQTYRSRLDAALLAANTITPGVLQLVDCVEHDRRLDYDAAPATSYITRSWSPNYAYRLVYVRTLSQMEVSR